MKKGRGLYVAKNQQPWCQIAPASSKSEAPFNKWGWEVTVRQ